MSDGAFLSFHGVGRSYGALHALSGVDFSLQAGETVLIHGADAVPTGFLECDGSLVSKTTYADLYTVLGATWGESGGDFNLPQTQGRFPLGKNTSSSFDVGETGGVNGASVTLAKANLPSYNLSHTLTGTLDAESAQIVGDSNIEYWSAGGGSGTGLGPGAITTTGTVLSEASQTQAKTDNRLIDGGTITIDGGTISSDGSGTSFSVLNPYGVFQYIIFAAV